MELSVKLFADGADLDIIRDLAADQRIKGFTTNPTLARKAGVTNYEKFARGIVDTVPDRPVSFEVFADDLDGMGKQARKIASWAPNINVKIPVTNTKAESTAALVGELNADGIAVNVTAIFTIDQLQGMLDVIKTDAPVILSVFAGRIADAGIDPIPIMRKAVELAASFPRVEILWASPREVLNAVQASDVGCHIITMTHDLLAKVPSLGKDLTQFSLETATMFYHDAAEAGFAIDVSDVS